MTRANLTYWAALTAPFVVLWAFMPYQVETIGRAALKVVSVGVVSL